MKPVLLIIAILIIAGGIWAYQSNKILAIDISIQPPETPATPTTLTTHQQAPTTAPTPATQLTHRRNFPLLPTTTPAQTQIPTPETENPPTAQALSPKPSGEAEAVAAFASCNGQYEGSDYDFRAKAAQLALDEQRQTLPQLKQTVNQYCEGTFKIDNAELDQIVAEKSPSQINPPLPTLYPTSTPRPTPAHSTDNLIAWDGRFNQEELEKLIHKKINNYRASRDLPPLKWVNDIAKAARSHSMNMAEHDYLDHLDVNNRTPTERLIHFDYSCYAGENIFQGYGHSRTWWQGPVLLRYEWFSQEEFATIAVQSWIDSAGHHKNMIYNGYTETGIGVGFGESDGIPHAIWVTQKFC